VKRLAAPLLVLCAVLWGAWVRVETALSDPGFQRESPVGLLRSDPALLYYFTERILEAGGGLPPDFRADPRVQHPGPTDIPAEFGLGQEPLVAWVQRLSGGQTPLHVTALRVSALTAALFLLGIYVAIRAASGSQALALLGALLALLTPANYRTIGFVLVREDLALPLFALHLGLVARALRVQRAPSFLWAGLALAAALASWHATGFLVALELVPLWLALLATGRSPFEARGAWAVLVAPLLAGLFVPALRASGWTWSLAAVLAAGPCAAAAARARWSLSRAGALGVALAASAAWLGLAWLLAPPAYAHVHQVLLSKLRFLGALPADPTRLSFNARLLWQGPFETLAPADLCAWLGWPLSFLLLVALATALWRWRELRGAMAFFLVLALVSLPVAWLFGRLAVLCGFLIPIAGALALASWQRRRLALAALALACLLQAPWFLRFVDEHRLTWYLPAEARAQLAQLIDWVQANMPADEAIAADFVNSPAILAHTGRPIVLQPKYETDASRRRAEEFLSALFHGTTDDLEGLLRRRFRCRYLLLDRYVLWDLSRYTAGLREDEPAAPGTAAQALLGPGPPPERAGAFELVYRSEPPSRWADFRLYRLREDGGR
jgi:hypothetical protein